MAKDWRLREIHRCWRAAVCHPQCQAHCLRSVELGLLQAVARARRIHGKRAAERFEAFPQTIKSMSPAMGHFERLLLDGRLVHDNPVLSTCVAHTTIRTDANGNRAPDKCKATHRIDRTVALIMALAMAPAGQLSSFSPEALIR